MSKDRKIKPELLGGFRDYIPDVMLAKQEVLSTIRRSFEQFGFLPLDTPALERSAVLGTDTNEFKMEVYRFTAGDQDVTLRFDLTVPLARVVAAYPEILKPFKRYQCGSVWRKEKPQAGRFREFTQFDADIVGSNSILADAEIITLMYTTMKNLGLDNFLIRFNNRKILNGLPEVASFEKKKAASVFRVLDKLEKIGLEAVLAELKMEPVSVFDEESLNLSDQSVVKITEFLSLAGASLSDLKKFFRGVVIAEEGIVECEEISQLLKSLDIPSKNWQFDLSVARGLGYYTGPVFETTLLDLPQIGSVFSGGRYDDLVTRFTGEKIPATGASVGVDRLIAALEAMGKLKKIKSVTKTLIAFTSKTLSRKAFVLAQKMRSAGINSEVFLGKEDSLKGQIIYALKQGIPFVIIMGEEEDSAGQVKIKDMNNRTETLIPAGDVVAFLKNR